MNSLLPELLQLTLSFLDKSTTYYARLVCKEWNSLLPTENITVEEYTLQCARDGHVTYLEPLRPWWNDKVRNETAANGHVACLAYLHENRGTSMQESGEYAAIWVAIGGHVDHCRRVANKHTLCTASGHLACVKYLYENGSHRCLRATLITELEQLATRAITSAC